MPAPVQSPLMPNVLRIADLVRTVARRQPDAPGLEFQNESFTFAGLYGAAVKLAHGLLQSGLVRGDRVGILAQNCPEYLVTYLACQLAGCAAVPVNFRLVGEDVAWVLGNCEARGLVVSEEYLPLAMKALEGLSGLRKGVQVILGASGEHPLTYLDIQRRPLPAADLPGVSPLDLSTIFYTSGTTGFPKGAMMSHLNVLTRLVSWGWDFGIGADDVVLVAGPVFHMSFSSIALITLAAGGRVVLMRDFEPEAALDLIERFGVTWSFLVPKMISLLADAAQARSRSPNLTSIKALLSSGSPLTKQMLDQFKTVFPGVKINDAYGWTETGWVTLCRHHDVMTRERTVGRAGFGCEIAILDENGSELPPGEVGEIYAANPISFLGYYGNPAATEASRRGKWESGGDLGFLDREGFLHIVDRKHDMIISGGENIYPAEIERVLAQCPKILELTVVGVPDDKWGESPRACVVLKPGMQATEAEIIAYCEGRLARYKMPRSVVILESLPRNAMGKVLRRELRERFWKGREMRVN